MASESSVNLSPDYLKEDISYQVVNTAIAFIVIDTLFTVLRVIARRLQKTRLMASDIFMPISLFLQLVVCTICLGELKEPNLEYKLTHSTVCVRYGVGRHTVIVSKENIVTATILHYYLLAPIYVIAATVPKMAILDLYLNIFTDKTQRYLTYGIGGCLILAAIANIVTTLAQCEPIYQLWNPVPDGWCHNIHAHFTWGSFPNMFSDLIMLMLPIPMIIRLHASWKIKLGIFLTFIMGSLYVNGLL
jgi:hypothetical protein